MGILGKSFFIVLLAVSCSFGGVVYKTKDFVVSPDNLSKFKYVNTLQGGSGGVDVYEFEGKKFTVKASTDAAHINEEIIADALYKKLELLIPSSDIRIPSFIVVDSLPSNFATSTQKWSNAPYRIAQFIEGTAPNTSDSTVIEKAKKGFVVDAFLGNRDIAGNFSNNIIVTKLGQIYRIDNGGALRYRSIGGRKGGEDDMWDSSLIPELKTLVERNSIVYQGIDKKKARTQMKEILSHSSEILETLRHISDALHISAQARTELNQMLVNRLRTLTVLGNPDKTYIAFRERLTSPFTSAGAFLLSQHEGKAVVLLGQRRSANEASNNETWVSLGGKADYGIDRSLATAASREIYEESDGKINIPDTDMKKAPSHDLVRPDHLFRQYFVNIPYVDVSSIKYHEYLDYKWVPLENLLSPKTRDTGIIKGTNMRIFQPFWDLLRTWQVYKILRQYLERKSLPQEVHTQSSLSEGLLKGDIISFSSELKATRSESETQLGEAIVAKSVMQRDILARSQGAEKKWEDHPYYSTNVDEGSRYRYTASEAHMKIYLGDTYQPITASDPETLKSTLRENAKSVLLKSGPHLNSDFTKDIFFNQQLLKSLMKERSLDPKHMVLYHATSGEIGFIYDIFTELRQLISGQFHQSTQIFRGIDLVFKEVDNIIAFQKKFGINSQENKGNSFKGNYDDNYPDFTLSANFFLFGNPERDTSSSFDLFFKSSSIKPISIEHFFQYLESILNGLRLNIDRYKRLYENIIGESILSNGRLYQIAIHPDYINTLVYTAITQGIPYYFDYASLRTWLQKNPLIIDGKAIEFTDILNSTSQSCSHKAPIKISFNRESTAPKGFFEVLKVNPDIFAMIENGLNPNDMQARLLVKPECLHNPKIVRTFLYHRTESAEKNHEKFLKTLRKYLAEDIAAWLQQKNKLKEGALASPSSLRAHYKKLYEHTFKEGYQEEDTTFQQELITLQSREDTALLDADIKKYGIEKVLFSPILTDKSYRDKTGGDYLIATPWVYAYVMRTDSPLKDEVKLLLQKKLEDIYDFNSPILNIDILDDDLHKVLSNILIKKIFNSPLPFLETLGTVRSITISPLKFLRLNPVKDAKETFEFLMKIIERLKTLNSKNISTYSAIMNMLKFLPIMSEVEEKEMVDFDLYTVIVRIESLQQWEDFKHINLYFKPYSGLVEKMGSKLIDAILNRSLNEQQIKDIIEHVVWGDSALNKAFKLNNNFENGTALCRGLITKFLNNTQYSFQEKTDFIKKVLTLKNLKGSGHNSLRWQVYSAVLLSSLPIQEKQTLLEGKKLLPPFSTNSPISSIQRTIEDLYDLYNNADNILKNINFIVDTNYFFGEWRKKVMSTIITIYLLDFTKKHSKEPTLNLEDASNLVHVLETLIPYSDNTYFEEWPQLRDHLNSLLKRIRLSYPDSFPVDRLSRLADIL